MPTLGAAVEVMDMEDALDSIILARFHSGEAPHGHTLTVDGIADAADLVPFDEVERTARSEFMQRVLVRSGDCSVLLERSSGGRVHVTVVGPSEEAVAKVAAAVRANAPVPDEGEPVVRVEFWHNGGRGPTHVIRAINAPAWSEVARNYPAPVASALSDLVARRRPRGQGRLLLWHGPPGTGKTTAARALAREWAGWCRTLFVVDADELFARGSYLASMLMMSEDDSDTGDDDEDEGRWRLLIIEDADELLRADAKRASGQAMARLLNLADGFLGQGLDLLILLSTNEPIGRLHPAVARPGRCLAEIGFRPFSRSEASAWLGGPLPSSADQFSLADLYCRRGDVDRIGPVAADSHPGQYL